MEETGGRGLKSRNVYSSVSFRRQRQKNEKTRENERNCLITATNCEEITQPVMFLGMREAGK